jgi:hypothetical protein
MTLVSFVSYKAKAVPLHATEALEGRGNTPVSVPYGATVLEEP